MTDKPLIITSIYAPSDLNPHWYKLQKEFIAKNTTIPYQFKIVLNGIAADDFDPQDILWINDGNEGHPAALAQLVNYFRSTPYSNYLILDSDCFPVFHGWHEILNRQMAQFKKTFAAPVRTENLDLFPHPCAFYIQDQAIHNSALDFSTSHCTNLLGESIPEVGGAMQSLTEQCLPLLRTNHINLHPIAAGIYHHLFYHHGAGSRDFNFRILKRYDYYSHCFNNDNREQESVTLFKRLINAPEKFIDTLMNGYS